MRTSARGGSIQQIENSTLHEHVTETSSLSFAGASRGSEYLANAMAEVHQKFGISKKVVAPTTNNGANYFSTFNRFGVTEGDSDREAEEKDDKIVESTPILVEEALEVTGLLPKHRRCGAHTVNLLASRAWKRFLA